MVREHFAPNMPEANFLHGQIDRPSDFDLVVSVIIFRTVSTAEVEPEK
jgi:hypothetical protein